MKLGSFLWISLGVPSNLAGQVGRGGLVAAEPSAELR